VFFIAGIAEVGRTPFDIYFAETEVVGGPFVEYSGVHWAVFFLAEYVNTFMISALIALLFLGGWVWPFDSAPPIIGGVLFLIKTYTVVLFIFWIRATYPRMRIDQLMGFGWKILIPLSFGAVTMVAVQQFYEWPIWTLTVMSFAVLSVPIGLQIRIQRQPAIERARKYAERAIAERMQRSR
jgi:NADH-quinone oxidoreductase subunit H